MNVVDYKAEARKVLDTLPNDMARIALNLLEYLKNQGAREESTSVSDGTTVGTLNNWIKYFTDHEKEELLEELLESIEDASANGDWSQVQEVIESWEETAEILSDEQLLAEIREAEEEIGRGETVSWAEAKNRLNLS